MAQFDVFANPNAASRAAYPYLIILQNDFAQSAESVIVAPLARKASPDERAQVQRPVVVNGEPLVLLFQAMSAMRVRDIGPTVTNLSEVRAHIMAAMDVLFLGF